MKQRERPAVGPSVPAALPAYEPGQAYLDHAERLLQELGEAVLGMVKDRALAESFRVAAADTALAVAEAMRDLKYPPDRAGHDFDHCAVPRCRQCSREFGPAATEEEDDDEEEEGGRGWFGWWRRRR